MQRRPLSLVALSLFALSLTACADATAPTPSNARVKAPSGQASFDMNTPPDDCRGGTMSSTGKAC